MKVSTPEDLGRLRAATGLDRVDIDLARLLHGNLPLYATRSALWALRPGGRLHLQAAGTIDSVSFRPGRWSFQLLTQLVCKAADGLGLLLQCDRATRSLVCERSAPAVARSPWSAAVVYSGQAGERSQLAVCLERLQAQPEIRDGGQLIVCGPPDAADHVSALPEVEYLALPTPTQAGRFLVGAKKMAAIRAARHERVLVCHTRVALRDGCLAALPAEFDVITPRVWVDGAAGKLPYLDLGFFDTASVALYSTNPQLPIHYDRMGWWRHLGRQYPYVDGGLFCVRRSLALEVPLSSSVAWGEGEDAEWSLRLLHGGRLLEIALDAHADSLTCKTARYARWGHLAAYRGLSLLNQRAQSIAGLLTRSRTDP